MNQEKNITIELTVSEVNVVLQTLGNLPTSSGVWPLAVKIKNQADSQFVPPAPDKK